MGNNPSKAGIIKNVIRCGPKVLIIVWFKLVRCPDWLSSSENTRIKPTVPIKESVSVCRMVLKVISPIRGRVNPKFKPNTKPRKIIAKRNDIFNRSNNIRRRNNKAI